MNEAHKSVQKIYKNIYNSLNKIILYVRTSEIDFKHTYIRTVQKPSCTRCER